MSANVVNIAGYRFVALADLPDRKQYLLDTCRSLALNGTILLAPEGINVMLAGSPVAIDDFKQILEIDPLFTDFWFKESLSDVVPFRHMWVKIKKSLIPHVGAVNANKTITPEAFKVWQDEGRAHVLDVRNDYEVVAGKFSGAIDLAIGEFAEFPKAIDRLAPDLKDQPIVMYCTGGIRCEKASTALMNAGFKDVYQLEGGILNYFERVGGAHYQGDCFVFDERIALTPSLAMATNINSEGVRDEF